MISGEMRGQWNGDGMRLTHLDDGYELFPPWLYSKDPRESLGCNRYQVVVDGDMSEQELGRVVFRQAGFRLGRETLLDIRAWTPTSD